MESLAQEFFRRQSIRGFFIYQFRMPSYLYWSYYKEVMKFQNYLSLCLLHLRNFVKNKTALKLVKWRNWKNSQPTSLDFNRLCPNERLSICISLTNFCSRHCSNSPNQKLLSVSGKHFGFKYQLVCDTLDQNFFENFPNCFTGQKSLPFLIKYENF